jgi:hypothetical protein
LVPVPVVEVPGLETGDAGLPTAVDVPVGAGGPAVALERAGLPDDGTLGCPVPAGGVLVLGVPEGCASPDVDAPADPLTAELLGGAVLAGLVDRVLVGAGLGAEDCAGGASKS